MTSFLGSSIGLGSFMSQTTTTAVVPTSPIEDVKDRAVTDGEGGHSNGVEEKAASETAPQANHSRSNRHDVHEEKNLSPIKTDKSAKHTHSDRLEDQAATAALYVTKYDSGTNSGTNNRNGYDILDSDHKLSSAGAAASLKYARPRDLPSYPSAGLKKDDSAAGAAASLGWANQKSFEHWKPDPSSSASTAAMRAKDYKMAPLWQPEDSAHGAKAALLAHKSGGRVEIWRPEPTAWGNSAAMQAMGKKNTLSPQLDYGYTDIGRKGSLMAATGAMSSSRRRADSTPIPPPKVETYPDERNAAANALSAATSAHKSKRKTNISAEGGSVPFTNMPKEMYTSHPPVAPEVEEQNRQDVLRASAVAMAKQMYNVQQKQFDQAAMHGATAAHGRRPSSSAGSEDAPPMRFNNLQEAAQKLAQERLAKLHDEHAKNREYRDYYGHSTQPTSRLSIRGRTRRRASSDGNLDEDKEQSNKIRAQMSIFSSNLSQVDAKKRQSDREALIAAAQRNVTKSLHGMDEKVFADTGKVAPSLMSEWEVKAHAAAQAKSDTRMENYGKVHIGGGKFINQSAVDLVASRNVQPVLDEINEKAELERVRQAELKADQENERRKAAEKKAREKESKDIHKKLKQQDKDEEKLRKQEEKAARDEEKRAEKEKRKSAKAEAIPATAATTESATTATMTGATSNGIETTDEVASPAPVEQTPSNTIAERREVASTPAEIRTSMEDNASQRMRELSEAADKDQATTTPTSPTPPRDGGKVKNWLKTKFARRSSKAQKPSKDLEKTSSGFIGGAALTGASASNTSLGGNSASVRDVALASSTPVRPRDSEAAVEERVGGAEGRASTVSSVSSVSSVSRESEGDGEDEEFQEARDNFDEDLAPPPTFPVQKSSSPARSAKFTEEI